MARFTVLAIAAALVLSGGPALAHPGHMDLAPEGPLANLVVIATIVVVAGAGIWIYRTIRKGL